MPFIDRGTRHACTAGGAPLPTSRFERHSLVLLAVWSVYLAPGLALAGGPNKLDLVQAVSAAFDRADRNGDGYLSPEEAQRLPAIAKRFERLDTDGDGRLSREELLQGLQKDS